MPRKPKQKKATKPFEYIDEKALAKAQTLVYKAFEAKTLKTKLKYAQQAIETSAYCADAYNILGALSDNNEDSLKYYEQAVNAGYHAIGSDDFEDFYGEFWGWHETRPFMRAKHSLAQCLRENNQLSQAILHYEEMLEMNESDNQGIRYALLSCYLEEKNYDKAQKLIARFEEEWDVAWHFGRLLISYQSEGDTQNTRNLIQPALESNPHVLEYLFGKKHVDKHNLPDFYGMGDENQAIFYIDSNLHLWQTADKETSVLKWLEKTTASVEMPA